VRVSPDNPDIQTPARLDEVQDSLTACGIKLVKDPNTPFSLSQAVRAPRMATTFHDFWPRQTALTPSR
jgi:hypothetical protein